MGPIRAPNLLHLDLSQNEIKKLENFDGHARLEVLDLSSNTIVDTTNISKMPNLKELFLGFNRIKVMNGFDGLDSLKRLHLKSNMLTGWEEAFPALEALEYLNLRSNNILKIEEIEKLNALPKLRKFVCSFTPFVEKNPTNYIFQIMVKLPNLTMINKTTVTRVVRQQVIDYSKECWLEQKRIEEEEKKREEEEANKMQDDN